MVGRLLSRARRTRGVSTMHAGEVTHPLRPLVGTCTSPTCPRLHPPTAWPPTNASPPAGLDPRCCVAQRHGAGAAGHLPGPPRLHRALRRRLAQLVRPGGARGGAHPRPGDAAHQVPADVCRQVRVGRDGRGRAGAVEEHAAAGGGCSGGCSAGGSHRFGRQKDKRPCLPAADIGTERRKRQQ